MDDNFVVFCDFTDLRFLSRVFFLLNYHWGDKTPGNTKMSSMATAVLNIIRDVSGRCRRSPDYKFNIELLKQDVEQLLNVIVEYVLTVCATVATHQFKKPASRNSCIPRFVCF